MTTNNVDRIAETNLNIAVEARQLLKSQLDELTAQLNDLDQTLIKEFQAQGLKSVTTALGKVHLVQNNTVVWNEEILKEMLTPAQWNRVTVRKVDTNLLEAAVTVGRLEISLVEGAKSIKQSKPFLR